MPAGRESLSSRVSAFLPIQDVVDPTRSAGSHHQLRMLVGQESAKRRQVVEDLMQDIVKLHTYHNSLVPINALPAELLGLIFAYLVSPGCLIPQSPLENDLYRQGSDSIGPIARPGQNKDVIQVTHVCKQWRTVAIRDPFLWTSFPLHHPIGVKEFLARSKKLPVSLSLTRNISLRIARSVARSTSRIRSLHISTKSGEDIGMFWNEVSKSLPAPLLEELFVELLDADVRRIAVAAQGAIPWMSHGDVPSLRVLTLRGIVGMPFVLPATLVHLDLGSSQEPLPWFSKLLRMLSGCPLLQTLYIRGEWGWSGLHNNDIDPVAVALPNLAKAFLEVQPPEAPGIFLSSVSLPPFTDVAIASFLPEDEDFGTILGAIDILPSPPSCFSGFRRLHILWHGTFWQLQAYRDADDFLSHPALDIHSNSLDISEEQFPNWSGFLYDWLFDSSRIETFVIVYKPGLDQVVGDDGQITDLIQDFDAWNEVLPELPALKTLRVMGLPSTEMEGLLDALGGQEDSALSCPALSDFEVFDVEFSIELQEFFVEAVIRRVRKEGAKRVFKQVELFNCDVSDPTDLMLELDEFGVKILVDFD